MKYRRLWYRLRRLTVATVNVYLLISGIIYLFLELTGFTRWSAIICEHKLAILTFTGQVYEDAAFVAGGAVPPSAWEYNATGAIVHAFHHAYWGDWKFSVDKHDKAADTLHFGAPYTPYTPYTPYPPYPPYTYLHRVTSVHPADRGGFQEARGSCGTSPFNQMPRLYRFWRIVK